MRIFTNPTRQFLLGFATVFLLGAGANFYFVCKPSSHVSPEFNPTLVWDWAVLIVNTAFILYFYLILKNARSPYARTYWLTLLGIFAAGYAEKYFLRLSSDAEQLFSAICCCLICAVSILFLQLYQKRRFSLFDGLTYRLNKPVKAGLKQQ